MHFRVFLSTVIPMLLLAGCAGGAVAPAATATKPAGATPALPAATVPAQTAPTIAAGKPAAKSAATAKEAFPAADAKAKSVDPSYQLYDVSGSYGPAFSNTYQKDSNLVEGRAVSWRFAYVKPLTPGDIKGYKELQLWVDASGLQGSVEKTYDQQVAKKPKGLPADWKIDSTEAIRIVEDDRTRAFRQQNPQWDPARPESDRNAVIIARLEFIPYWDVNLAKGKEFPGEKSVVWTIKYPPLDRWIYVIDAYSGKVLLKTDK